MQSLIDWRKSWLMLIFLFTPLTTLYSPNLSAAAEQVEATPSVSAAQIDRSIRQIREDADISAEEKEKLLALGENAKARLQDAEIYKSQLKEYEKLLETGPIARPKVQLPDAKFEDSIARSLTNLSLEKLDVLRLQAQSKLTTSSFALRELESRLESEANAPVQINVEKDAAQKRLKTIQAELEQLQTSQQPGPRAEAQRLFLLAKAKANLQQIKMLDKKALSFPIRTQQINAELESARAEQAKASLRVHLIEETIARQSMDEAEKIQAAIAEAEKQAADKPGIVREQIKRNAALSSQLSIMLNKIASTTRQKEELQEQARQLDADFKNIQKRLHVTGLNFVLGEVLRKQDRRLAQNGSYKNLASKLKQEAEWVGINQITIDARRQEIDEIPGIHKGSIAIPASETIPEENLAEVGAELFLLLQTEKELLDKLEDTSANYLRILEETDFERQKLTEIIESFRAFLDEHLLWTPSAEPLNWIILQQALMALQWFINPKAWFETVYALYDSALNLPVASLLGVFLVSLLLLAKQSLKNKLLALNGLVSKLHTDRFHYTFQAAGYTILIALPIPLLLLLAGWLLTLSSTAQSFSIAVGHGLIRLTVVWFLLYFFYQLFKTTGIAAIHFRWSGESLKVLRQQLMLLRIALPGLLFVVAMTASQSISAYSNSLGRLAFIGTMILMGLVLFRLLSPRTGVLVNYYISHPDSVLYRMRYLWPGFGILIPLVVIGFAVAGYYVSALELQKLLILTIRLVFAAVLIHALVIRLLNLSNRRMALKKAREKRLAERAEKEAAAQLAEGAENAPPITSEELDIPTINAQTRQLLRTAIVAFLLLTLWAVWADLFPALAVVDDINLWQSHYLMDGETITDNITLADLLVAFIYIGLSVVTIRNLPGILELILFQNMTLDTGSRYAINHLIRYALVAISVFLIANALGGHWQQVQWLVAALGVGLGFGLQEIFANMVSGIIILFERPIRVGDTVSVGGISGNVTRIQMRATTITDWDRKELIVPNKTFITEQLVNWTLTDPITRLVIPLGISYESDVDLAQTVIRDVIQSHALVLADPPPQIFFMGFGDSSLDFEIRVFVKELANRLPLQHDLLVLLTKALRKHQIEIPFPQRDLHLRTVPEAWQDRSDEELGPGR